METTSVGVISLDMILNSAQFRKQMNSVQNQANATGQKMAASFKKVGAAIAAAFSVAAIKNFGQECIDLGSDLTEVQNVVDVTFTSMSDKVNEWAINAKNAYGLSEAIAKKYVGLYGTMSRQFGFTEKQAYEMSTTLAGLAGDVASYYNITQSEAYTKLKAVYSGETEVLKDIGIVMTQSALDTYALANGYGKTTSAMTEAEKVTLRYNFILNQLHSATGDFVRTQDNWANQTRVLQLKFESLKATIGQGLINAFTPVIKVVNSLMDRLTTVSEKFKALTEQIFGNAGGTSSGSTSYVENLTDEATASSAALNGVTDSAEKAKRSVAGFDKLNVLSSSNSSSDSDSDTSSATTGSSDVSPATSVASNTEKGLNNAFKNLFENSGFQTFIDKVQTGIKSVNWSSIKENCKSIFNNLKPIAESAFKGFQKVGKSVFGTLGSYIGGVISVYGKSLDTLSGGIAKWLERDGTKITTFIDTISTNFANGFDNLSTFFNGWFNIMGDSIDRMRPKMENAIAELLGGFTDFGGAVGTVTSEGFEIATASLVEWLENDGAEIGLFFDNIQSQIADVMTLVGGVYSDLGTTISTWWNGDGAGIFQNMCDMFNNIGTTLMNVYNEWIMPAWDFIVGVFQSAWNNCLKPIFEKSVSFFGKLTDCISTVWNNFLSPTVNWIINVLGPVFVNVFNTIKGVLSTVFTVIGDVVGGILDALGGVLDFITGVFSGDWEKAWDGIKSFFEGIWDAIWGICKGVINLIIDGINGLWSGIYTAISSLINGIGSIAGAIGDLLGKDWSFSMPDEPPLIPKLAKGGIVKAPTLAVVGDNAGANTGNPEVIAPLNKLQSMINTSNGQDVVILTQILDYLKRIYEMFVIFRNQGGNMYEFVATLNGSVLFDELVKQNELYKKRHNGKSAFT